MQTYSGHGHGKQTAMRLLGLVFLLSYSVHSVHSRDFQDSRNMFKTRTLHSHKGSSLEIHWFESRNQSAFLTREISWKNGPIVCVEKSKQEPGL